ncbi:hypothetical protein TWF694_005026 [Orbilia ellipsospora]|uniref:Uncharacterized protein n=1 Tax=Orbilia ellipsospora TaxID=2528407 RepID=A0AAV9WVR0_9PEZI
MLLSYFSPSAAATNTVYTDTSTFTDPSLQTITTTVSDVTFGILTSTITTTNLVPITYQKRQQLPPVGPAAPSQLSAYSSSAISSACTRAATSPLSTYTSTYVLSEEFISTVNPLLTQTSYDTSYTSTFTSSLVVSQNYYAYAIFGYTPTAADQGISYYTGSAFLFLPDSSGGGGLYIGFTASSREAYPFALLKNSDGNLVLQTTTFPNTHVLLRQTVPTDPVYGYSVGLYPTPWPPGFVPVIFDYDTVNQTVTVDSSVLSSSNQPLYWYMCDTSGYGPTFLAPDGFINAAKADSLTCQRLPSGWFPTAASGPPPG